MEKWLADFHRRKNPDRDNKRRHATQLELWVSEAKVLWTFLFRKNLKNQFRVCRLSNVATMLNFALMMIFMRVLQARVFAEKSTRT